MKRISKLLCVVCMLIIACYSLLWSYSDVRIVRVWISDHVSDTRYNVMFENRGDESTIISVMFLCNDELINIPKRIGIVTFEKEILDKLDDEELSNLKDMVTTYYVLNTKTNIYILKHNVTEEDKLQLTNIFKKIEYGFNKVTIEPRSFKVIRSLWVPIEAGKDWEFEWHENESEKKIVTDDNEED